MKASITVTLRNGILDPQGSAVMNALNSMDAACVKNVRIGKLIEIEIDESDPAVAKETLAKMCDRLLANPVMENYHIEFQTG